MSMIFFLLGNSTIDVSQPSSPWISRNANFPSGDLFLIISAALSEEPKQLAIRTNAEATNTFASIVIDGHHKLRAYELAKPYLLSRWAEVGADVTEAAAGAGSRT